MNTRTLASTLLALIGLALVCTAAASAQRREIRPQRIDPRPEIRPIPRPNLQIQSIEMNLVSGDVVDGRYIFVTVRNAGTAHASASMLRVRVRVDGGAPHTYRVQTPFLLAGQNARLLIENYPVGGVLAGEHQFSIAARADIDGQVTESNENDNTGSIVVVR